MTTTLVSLNYNAPKCDLSLDRLPVMIGSSPDADIRLDNPYVSPYHCRVDLIAGKLVLRDLESVHGTFVNGERVDETTLTSGDELAIGMLSFYVQSYADQDESSEAREHELHHDEAARHERAVLV